MPRITFAVGCHPHNAQHYTPELEARLRERLHDARVVAVGEIGLDYHYDLSPREDQKRAFRAQLRLAHEAGLPVSLHIREAHADAFQIMEEEGWPEAGTILHCCTVGWDELEPWVNAGCYVAYGGALTFGSGEAIREGAMHVPLDRLLLETDSPYMAPVPLRGMECEPAQVIFTADKLAELRGFGERLAREEFVTMTTENAYRILMHEPTAWQLGEK